MTAHLFFSRTTSAPLPLLIFREGANTLRRKTLPLFAVAISLAMPVAWASEPDQGQQLKQLRGEIHTLQQHLKNDKQEKARLFSALKQADKKISRLSRSLKKTRKQLNKQRKIYHQTQAKISQLQKNLAQHKEQLTQHMRSGYSAGQQPALKLLLNQSDPAQAGRVLTYYRYFTQAQLQAIDDTRASVQRLSAAEEALRRETLKLSQLQQEQESQLQRLGKTKTERKQLLANLDQRIQTKEQKLQHLVENEKRLASLLKDLEKQATARAFQGQNLSQLKRKLKWPTRGKLLHRFGTSRDKGDLKWQGVLIGGKEGQNIHAIAPGKVVFSDWLRGYGLTLIIDHGNSYMSIYSHNQSLYKDVHDKVEGRELIASMGSSGGNDKQGLYFEIRHQGRPVNPARWCR